MPSAVDLAPIGRRRYLALVTGSITAGLAGCADDTGTDTDGNGVEIDHYTDWIPAHRDVDAWFIADRPAELWDAVGYEPHHSVDGELLGIDTESVDRRVEIGPYAALSGEFTADEVVDGLGVALEADGTIDDYDRYTEETRPERAHAVLDGAAVLRYPGSTGDAALLEAIVDAQTGAGERLVDEDDDIALLVNTLPSGDLVEFGRTSLVDSWTATGASYDFDATRAAVTQAVVVTDEAALAEFDDDEIVDRLEFAYLADPEDPVVSREGRTVTVTGTVANEEIE